MAVALAILARLTALLAMVAARTPLPGPARTSPVNCVTPPPVELSVVPDMDRPVPRVISLYAVPDPVAPDPNNLELAAAFWILASVTAPLVICPVTSCPNDGAALPDVALPKIVLAAALDRANERAGVVVGVATLVVNNGDRLPDEKILTLPPPVPPPVVSSHDAAEPGEPPWNVY